MRNAQDTHRIQSEMGFTSNVTVKLEKCLYLEERKGAANYKVRALVRGKYHFKNTETASRTRAERVARAWFRSLQREEQGRPREGAMWKVGEMYLASLSAESAAKFSTHRTKWYAVRDFFKDLDVAEVDSKVLNDFVKARRSTITRYGTAVSKVTIKKNLSVLHQMLKWANRERLIEQVPIFPPLGRIETNPRPWFEREEWQTLQRVARERMTAEGLNARVQRQREELYDFMMMMVHSCARVDEVRRLRVRDCVIKTKTADDYAKKHRKGGTQYLQMWIEGKTGGREAIGWSGAVTSFERCRKRLELKLGRPPEPNDLVFEEHHRDGFRELLEAAGLRVSRGKTRNLKSLRSTGLMLRIVTDPKINLKFLALSAGTSISMLDTFYLKYLSLKTPAALSELV